MAAKELRVARDNVSCLRITSRSGRVVVVAEPRDDIALFGGSTIAEMQPDGTLSISSALGTSTIEVRCPSESNLVVGTASGTITVDGPVGNLRATSASGAVSVESARSADLRSESGSVSIKQCGERCRVQTASGEVTVGSVQTTEVATGSGRVSVGHASGKARVRTASGRVDVGASGEGDIAIETMSGGVTVRLPAGTRPAARLYGVTGHTHCELAEGNDCKVAVRSINGKIDVVCA